jgi:starch-binding outer membrane protein, SusD/RagB family
MKTNKKLVNLLVLSFISLFAISCEKYLDKAEQADVTDKDIFKEFKSFQGFVEVMYGDIVDISKLQNAAVWNWGDDMYDTRRTHYFWLGDYWSILTVSSFGGTPFWNSGARRGFYKAAEVYQGYWQNGWAGIRTANIALAHLGDLVNATDEERRLLEGQAYFFRAYLHWEIMRAWGAVPYVDVVLAPGSDMRIPQLTFHETTEKVLSDLKKAAESLPVDWDLTEVGGRNSGQNLGRITKGMALAFQAEVLLYCGSPLMNGASTGSFTYHNDYMKRSAEAAWEVIKLANQGVYGLQPWGKYSDMFYMMNTTVPYSKEIIFKTLNRGDSRWNMHSFQFAILGGGNTYGSPTQNYLELFEMANGLPIDDPESGFDEMDPWKNLDPRFYFNIVLDGERFVQNLPGSDPIAFAQLYIGGRERTPQGSLTGYGWKKFRPLTANSRDAQWGSRYIAEVPRLRLAEIYLYYAEAVNEAFGPNGSVPGSNFTAVDAVNKVRERANMPPVHAKFTLNKELFRDRIWAERAVELAFENKRWYDIRRWYVAHLDKYKEMYELQFDKNKTYFRRRLFHTRVFELRHYWLPFPTREVNLYSTWKQNPGW